MIAYGCLIGLNLLSVSLLFCALRLRTVELSWLELSYGEPANFIAWFFGVFSSLLPVVGFSELSYLRLIICGVSYSGVLSMSSILSSALLLLGSAIVCMMVY